MRIETCYFCSAPGKFFNPFVGSFGWEEKDGCELRTRALLRNGE